jgi:hypothetical protein
MSKANEFRQYAEEALRGAAEANSDQEKQALIKLARTWSQAAAVKAELPAPPAADSETHKAC